MFPIKKNQYQYPNRSIFNSSIEQKLQCLQQNFQNIKNLPKKRKNLIQAIERLELRGWSIFFYNIFIFTGINQQEILER